MNPVLSQPAAKLDPILQEAAVQGAGISLLIENNDKVVYASSAGIANDSGNFRIDTLTNFRMASVSKQFTAMAILLLEKEGKLSFEDPVRKYLPELPVACNNICLKHLLTHSSGIWDYEALIPGNRQIQVLDADVLQLLQTKDSVYFPAGAKFQYSNSGFCLLSIITERISGQSFASFVRDRIFTPLKMQDSRVYMPGIIIPHRAMGYAKDRTGKTVFSDQSITSATKGDGGVYTSVADYRKWVHALQEDKLVSIQSVIKRLQFKISSAGKNYYAAGWFELLSQEPVLFHSGSTCGFNDFVIWMPSTKLSIVMFSNLADRLSIFSKVLMVLKEEGIGDFSAVLKMHALTN